MKKKFLIFVLTMFLLIPGSLLVACGHNHKIVNDFSYNDTYHYHVCEDKDCTETFDVEQHQVDDDWSSDSTSHWKDCGICGYDLQLNNHEYDNNCDTTCNTCLYIRKAPHDLVEHAATPESCTTDGNLLYYTCNDCPKVFKDNLATEEYTDTSYILIHTGHSYEETGVCHCGNKKDVTIDIGGLFTMQVTCGLTTVSDFVTKFNMNILETGYAYDGSTTCSTTIAGTTYILFTQDDFTWIINIDILSSLFTGNEQTSTWKYIHNLSLSFS